MAKIGRPRKDAEVVKIVKVDGRDINAILTRDQRLALLAESIRSGNIKDSDLVKAIQCYTDLAADDPAAEKFTLIVKDKIEE